MFAQTRKLLCILFGRSFLISSNESTIILQSHHTYEPASKQTGKQALKFVGTFGKTAFISIGYQFLRMGRPESAFKKLQKNFHFHCVMCACVWVNVKANHAFNSIHFISFEIGCSEHAISARRRLNSKYYGTAEYSKSCQPSVACTCKCMRACVC